MMKNLKILSLLLMLTLFASCAQVRERSGQGANTSNASNTAAKSGGGVNVPRNMKNAYRDGELSQERAAIVVLPNNTDILYRKDAQKLSVDDLGKKFEDHYAATGADEPKTLYIVADAGVDYGAVVKVLELARRKRINNARLVVSQNAQGEPTDVFDVLLPKEVRQDGVPQRPNPNYLGATLIPGGSYRLNMEDVTLDALSRLLSEVFKDREARGVFREGTNEIEQTVTIQAPLSAKYEEVVRMIDAVKQSGANPIVIQLDEPEIKKVYFK